MARHSRSFNREDASSGAEFPVMPTGYRSSPSSLDSLGHRVDQRGLSMSSLYPTWFHSRST